LINWLHRRLSKEGKKVPQNKLNDPPAPPEQYEFYTGINTKDFEGIRD